jgi:hypothetical protein
MMQSSPTTVQILEGLRVELRQTVLPEVGAGPARVAVEMLDNVLSNLATRAAHEIAWMRDEAGEIDRLADEVDDPATRSALAAYRETDRESLHLADVQVAYDHAGEVLSCAVEHALDTNDTVLLAASWHILKIRSAREMAILGDWNMVGRG